MYMSLNAAHNIVWPNAARFLSSHRAIEIHVFIFFEYAKALATTPTTTAAAVAASKHQRIIS